MTNHADSWDDVTRTDLIAQVPQALDAIALGADETEILIALADASPRALRALAAVEVHS